MIIHDRKEFHHKNPKLIPGLQNRGVIEDLSVSHVIMLHWILFTSNLPFYTKSYLIHFFISLYTKRINSINGQGLYIVISSSKVSLLIKNSFGNA